MMGLKAARAIVWTLFQGCRSVAVNLVSFTGIIEVDHLNYVILSHVKAKM